MEQHRKKDPKSTFAAVQKAVTYLLLTIWAVIVLFPFYWMVLTSLKDYGAYNAEHTPSFFTLAPTLENYRNAFTAVPLMGYLLNTLIFTVITTALMLFVITLAAYAFARLNFRGKDLVFTLFLSHHQLCHHHQSEAAQHLRGTGTAVGHFRVLHLFIERKF